MTANLKNIANIYFNSWKEHDFKTLRAILLDDVIFIGALGKASGIDEYMTGFQNLANIIIDIH
jgi:hypothetical protein